jgi:asparagine synthetase A
MTAEKPQILWDWSRSRSQLTCLPAAGEIVLWNPVTRCRHELPSMCVQVTKETLRQQLEMSGQLDLLELPSHQAILKDICA